MMRVRVCVCMCACVCVHVCVVFVVGSVWGGLLVVFGRGASLLLEHVLALDTAGLSADVGRGGDKLDVASRRGPDHKGGDVDDLLADTDVSLLDQHASVVDGPGKPELEDLGLQTAVEEVLGGEAQDEIKSLLLLVEDTEPREPAEEGLSLKEPRGVVLSQSEKVTGSSSEFGDGKLSPPHLALVLEPVGPDDDHLLIQPLLLEGTTGGSVGLRCCKIIRN